MDTRAEHQPAESLRDQLRTAEVNLKAAMTHFRALRKAAFAGRYDPDEFDQAVRLSKVFKEDEDVDIETAAVQVKGSGV